MKASAALMAIAILLVSVFLQFMSSETYRLWAMEKKLKEHHSLAAIDMGRKILRKRASEGDPLQTPSFAVSSNSRLGNLLMTAFREEGQHAKRRIEEELHKGDVQAARGAFDRLMSLRYEAGLLIQEEDVSGWDEWSHWLLTSGALLSKGYADAQKWEELARFHQVLLLKKGLTPARALEFMLPECGWAVFTETPGKNDLQRASARDLKPDRSLLALSDMYASASSICMAAGKNEAAKSVRQLAGVLRESFFLLRREHPLNIWHEKLSHIH